jgi:hypothetical protein
MKNLWKCTEADEEPETESTEALFQLGCYISQGEKDISQQGTLWGPFGI